MTKTRSTKRALLISALALVMCISMLIGSTFAWFTDSVTSGNNKIVAGNLDVVLEYKTDWSDDWTTVDENTKIFKEGALYEPGYTEVVYLRVSNAGSLALKYNLMVNVTSEKESTNVYGDKFKLSDYLQIGTYMQDEYSSGYNYADILMPYMFGTREAALAKVSTPAADVTPLTKLSAANSIVRSNSPVLAGEQTAQVMAIVLTMPETVGNEANHKSGVAAPELNLGISLVATQYTDEYDSFGNQYDKDADYVAYFTSGKHELNTTLMATKATDVVTATGEGTEVKIVGGNYDAGDQECAVWAKDGAVVNIYDGMFTHNGNADGSAATSANHIDMIYAGTDGKINIYGGTFAAKNNGVWLLNEKDNSGEIVVYGGTFINWNPADNDSEGAHTNFVAEGYDVVTAQQGNDTVYTVVQLASSASELTNAIANAKEGTTVVLTDDVQVTNLKVEKNITLDLGDNEIQTNAWGGLLLKNGASLRNGTVKHINAVAAIKAWNVGTIENVTIDVTTATANNHITGIAVQEGKNNGVDVIRNVTIKGASQGIEVKNGSWINCLENVTVEARTIKTNLGTALQINGGNIGKSVNCSFEGECYGVNMLLKGEYDVALELENCTVTGGSNAIWAHDEKGISNVTNCSLTLTYDKATALNGGLNWDFEDECQGVVTLNKPN